MREFARWGDVPQLRVLVSDEFNRRRDTFQLAEMYPAYNEFLNSQNRNLYARNREVNP